jgi:alkylation response protein AidB-like acyl-CoA dehydrogenase
MGITLTGNTVLVYGTEDQKQRYLPRILSAEDIWCQGFSEPGAGSDLASLSTRATAVDGGWSINGQKVWTSNGHLANKCMLLARTDPDATKHHGITYFLSDMDQIDVRPLVMINGDAEFNEMFIDGQFVAPEDVLGNVNDGWRVANTTLAFERTTVALNLQVWSLQMLDRLVGLVRRLGLTADEAVVERVAEFYEQTHAVRISSVQTMSLVAAGGQPGPASSGVKLVWAALMQQMSRFALELAGTDGQIVDRPEPGYWVHRYLRARGHSIEGGSDEVQKSIIAEHVLGLPRSR